MKHSKRSAPCHNQAGVVIESLEPRQLLSATAYYVSPTGSDFNPGTVSAPWQHIQYGVDQLAPGNTLYLMQGSYAESVTMHVSGTAAAPITISKYSTDAVYLGSESAGQPVLNLGSEDYITVKGLFFQGAAAGKIVGQGGIDGLTLKNLYLTGGDGGILIGDGVDEVRNITIDTVHVDVATGDGIAFNDVDGLTIRNSQCFNSGEWVAGTGIGIYADGQNITVQNVLINGWAVWGIQMAGQNVEILRTTVLNSGGGVWLIGNDMKVENSLSISNFHEALFLAGSGPFTLRQNLVGFPAVGGAMQWGASGEVISVAASGNIFVSDVDYPNLWVSPAADLSGDHNLYYNPAHPDAVIQLEGGGDFSGAQIASGAWAAAGGMDAHSLYCDPMFSADYHLTSSSPAIDFSPNGPIVDRDNKLRPSGRGYDLGPYEFLGLPDQVAPVVSAKSIGHVTARGATFYEFTVTYKDNQAVSVNTLDGNDILVTGPGGFSQLAQLVSVSAATDGKVRTARYRITPPGGSWDGGDDGVYTVALQANQVSDPRGNFVAAGVLGTFNVNAFDAIGRFGDVDGKKTKLTLTDSDGTLVTFSLSGHGTGVITASAGGGWDLNLVNTDSKTAAAVSTKRSAAPADDGKSVLGDINCLAAVKSITAKTTNLRGDLTAASTLASLTMSDVIGGQSTIDVSGAGKMSVVLNVVSDLSIQAPNMSISAIKAVRWTDTDATADQVVCQSLGSLSVKGNKKLAIAGDFQADVIATSTSAHQGIGKITVANWLDGSQVRSAGSIGSVTVGAMRDSLVFAGVRDSVDGFGELIAGGSAAFVSTAVSIGSVTVKGLPAEQFSVINSSVAAWTVTSASLMNVRTDNSGGSGEMGLAGHYIKSYLRKTATVVDLKSGKQLGSKVIESVGDYTVQLF